MADRDNGGIIGGGIGGFSGITFDDSSGLVVQAPTVYVRPTVTPVPDWEPRFDRDILLPEIVELRDKIRSIPDEYLRKAGLSQTEIAEIRNQASTGVVYYDWTDIHRIEAKLSTAEQLMKYDKAQADALKPVPVSSTTTQPAVSSQPTQPKTQPAVSSQPTQPPSWASFRQTEAKTSPQYADKEARELLIQRAWNLPWLNRLIDGGLTVFDFAKIRDNEQMTWREYYELERKIAEAERKAGIDSSDAIRKAKEQMEMRPELAREVVEEKPIETGIHTQVCKYVLFESFYTHCKILPYKSGVTRVIVAIPGKNENISFTVKGLLNFYDGIAKVNLYSYTCDKSKIRVDIIGKNDELLVGAVLQESDISVEKAGEIAGDLFKEGNWWIYLLIGVGILVLVFLLNK